MPPNRIEPTATGPEASHAAPAPVIPPPAGAPKAWLPLVITVAVMPVLAYLMTTLVLVPKLQKGLAATASSESGDARPYSGSGGKKETVVMNKLLVNVSGTMGSRYLLVSLALAGSDPKFRTILKEYDPQLRDMACGALQTKTLADLEKPGARNLIRTELITGFNNILGETLIQDIYFTEFAIQ
jgi:flagellar FliL protein